MRDMSGKSGVVQPESPSPGDVRLTINSRCNQRCLFCGRSGNFTSGSDMTGADAARIIRQLRRDHPEATQMTITGGEPTLSPALLPAIGYARELGFRDIIMTTNGIRLADADLANALRDAGLNRLIFSLHSPVSRTFDRITGTRGIFPRAIKALYNAVTRFDVMVNMVINKHNYRETPAMVRVLSLLQARSKASLRLMPSIVVIEDDPVHSTLAWADISIPNSKLIPYLARAVRYDHAQARPILLDQFDGYCYFPMCACRDHPELLEHAPRARAGGSIWYVDPDAAGGLPHGRRLKLTSCRSCRYDPVCLGIASGYAALYGFGELVPL